MSLLYICAALFFLPRFAWISFLSCSFRLGDSTGRVVERFMSKGRKVLTPKLTPSTVGKSEPDLCWQNVLEINLQVKQHKHQVSHYITVNYFEEENLNRNGTCQSKLLRKLLRISLEKILSWYTFQETRLKFYPLKNCMDSIHCHYWVKLVSQF